MPYEHIKVTAYSGFRGEESPKTFYIEGRKIIVVEILDLWIEESVLDKDRKRFFLVKGNDNHIYKLYNDEQTFNWFVKEK